jgi:hypothetical protein
MHPSSLQNKPDDRVRSTGKHPWSNWNGSGILNYRYSLALAAVLVFLSSYLLRSDGPLTPLYLSLALFLLFLTTVSFFSTYLGARPDFWDYLLGREKSMLWPGVFRVLFAGSLLAAGFYPVLPLLLPQTSVFSDSLPKIFLVTLIMLSGPVLLLDAWRNNKASLIGVGSYRLASARKKQLILLAAVIIGLLLRLSMNTPNFREDEFQHLAAAVGYLETGSFDRWDFVAEKAGDSYRRSWPFTWLVAQSFKVLGVSPLSGRAVSLAWGLAMIVLANHLGKTIARDERAGLALAWLTAVSMPFITTSMYIRMYAMFIVVFSLFIYLAYRGIEGGRTADLAGGVSWRHVAAAVPLFLLAYFVHVITLVASLGIIAYLLFGLAAERRFRPVLRNKYAVALAVLAAGATAAVVWVQLQQITAFGLGFISIVSKTQYLGVAVRPVPMLLGLPLLALGLISSLLNRKLLFFAAILAGGLIFFVFFGNRYVSNYYISNLLPLSYLFIIVGLLQVKQLIPGKLFNLIAVMAVSVTLFNVTSELIARYERLPLSSPSYDRMYSYLDKEIAPNSTVWLALPRNYYLARYPRLASRDIRKVTRGNEKFNIETLDKMLDDGDRFYVVWSTTKTFHVRPEIREYLDDRTSDLSDKTEKYGFRMYDSAANPQR